MCLVDVEFSLSQRSFPWRIFFYPSRLWSDTPSSVKPSWASPGITGRSLNLQSSRKIQFLFPSAAHRGALCRNPSGLLHFLYQSKFHSHRNHVLAPPSPVQCPAHCEWPLTVWMGWMTVQSIYQATYHLFVGTRIFHWEVYRGATWLQIVAISISWLQPRSTCETQKLCQPQDSFKNNRVHFKFSLNWV